VRNELAEKGYDPHYGARPLGRIIQTEIKDVLSEEILFGKLKKGGKVFIDFADGRFDFSFSVPGSQKPEILRETETAH
jgi:ATP-dependent Clp protease ATP-binding subunit ClpA